MRQKNPDQKLFDASVQNHIKTVREVLEQGANVNAINNFKRTPLIYAAWHGHTDIVKLLIKHGADVNLIDCDGNTALINACRWGHTEIAKLLIEHGAYINIRNDKGQTALDILKERHPQKYQKLIEDTVIKARKEQLNTEDSLTRQDVLPDWNI